MSLNFITNRNVRVTCNSCRRTKTTTKDIFHNCTVDDVHRRIIGIACRRCIGCIFTTAIDAIVNSTTIDIYGYCILWSTEHIITAKHIIGTTTININSYCTMDVCGMFCLT